MLINFLEEDGMENLIELDPTSIPGKTKIFLNGSWVGVSTEPENIIKDLRTLRRNNCIPP